MTGLKLFLCFGLVLSLVASIGQAQHAVPDEAEELLLELKVERELTFDFSAILNGDQLYLPATRLFSILGSRYEFEKGQSVFKIRLDYNDTPVVLDLKDRTIEGGNSGVTLKKHDFFIRGEELYLDKSFMEELFGYTIIFIFRKLEIMLFGDHEFQVVKQEKRKARYQDFENNQLELIPDVTEGRTHQLLSGWIMDWALNSTHTLHNQGLNYGAGFGGEVLGGDLNVQFTGSKEYGFHWHDTRGRWRYPVYSTPLLTQVTAGMQSTDDKVNGFQRLFTGINITNRPLSSRRRFDRYTISSSLHHGWDAGLEVNGRLRGVALAGEDEKYNFTIPLTYGSNTITVNRYDEQGYNHPQKYHVYIPQDLLPPNEFEYNLSLGRYSNSDKDFGKLNLKWGASPHLTIGGGAQYLASSQEVFGEGQAIPFFQMWSRLGNSVYLRGEHTLDYVSKASMRVIFPNSQLLRFSGKKFHRPSAFNKTNRSLELSMTSSFSITLPFVRLNTSYSTQYFENRSSEEFMNLFGSVNASLPAGFRLNVRSRGQFRNMEFRTIPRPQRLETEVSISKRMFGKLFLRPGISYNHTDDEIRKSRLEAGGRIFENGNLGVSIDHNHIFSRSSMQLNFSLDLPFGRHSSQLRSNYNRPSLNQRTSGTIAFNGKDNQLYFDRKDWTNKAAITLNPFLDLNNNSEKDPSEPLVSGLGASIYRKGNNRPTYKNRSKVTRLAPYDRYIVRLNPESLQNPLWSPKSEVYEVQPKPNQFTHINIPIVVQGEVSGKIEMEGNIDSISLSGLEIQIASQKESFKEVVRTYSGGQFYYVGLTPGDYVAKLNPSQLEERALVAKRDSVEFTIEVKRQGDIVDGLELQVVDTEKTEEKSPDRNFAIQIGAFRLKENAEVYAALSKVKLGHVVEVIYNSEQEWYECQIRDIPSKEEARQILREIINKPTQLYEDSFLIEMDRKNKL